MLSGKRIFVSGGAGVIGQALVDRLFRMGAEVFVGDLKKRPVDWHPSIRYRQGDLNFITQEELLDFSPHYFFHLAAAFERSVETYEFWNENERHNVRLSHHLMDCMRAMPELSKVVFASSYLIYDPSLYQFDRPQAAARSLSEQDPIYPRNQCGAAKLLHEIELRFLSEFLPFQTVCARIYRVYGKNSRDIVSRWIQALLRGERLTVFRKEGMFDYIYAEDVAEGLIRLAESEATGILNLGNQHARRVSEVLSILKEHFPALEFSEEPSDIPYEASEADLAKFELATGWRPRRSLEDTIPELIAHYRTRREVIEPQPANVLVTSVSRKVPLVQAVRLAADKLGVPVAVIGGDSNPHCIAAAFTDGFWTMPALHELAAEELIAYCKANQVRWIIPTRDGELAYFARNADTLEAAGIAVMVSKSDAVAACLDKLVFSETGQRLGFPVIPSVTALDDLDERDSYVVKERYGAGSESIGLALSKEEARRHAGMLKEPIYQPWIEGLEYSVDLYVDRKGKTKGVIARVREVVQNGESQITTAVRDPELESLCAAFAERLGLYGHVVFQVLKGSAGGIHVIECNSRFGGASTLSLHMGLDSFYWFMLESYGADLDVYPFHRSKQNKKMVRYAADLVV